MEKEHHYNATITWTGNRGREPIPIKVMTAAI